LQRLGGGTGVAYKQYTAATLPPTPLRSARPEGRVLQFCHVIGCGRRWRVAGARSDLGGGV